jgi:hypothetical protein
VRAMRKEHFACKLEARDFKYYLNNKITEKDSEKCFFFIRLYLPASQFSVCISFILSIGKMFCVVLPRGWLDIFVGILGIDFMFLC